MLLLIAVDMKSGDGEIYRSEPKKQKADCTIIIDDGDMVKIATGKLNGQQVWYVAMIT